MKNFLLLLIISLIGNTAIAQSITQEDVIPEQEYLSFEAHQAGIIVVQDTEEITDDWFSGTLDLSYMDSTGYSFDLHHQALITKNGDQLFYSRNQVGFNLREYYHSFDESSLRLDSIRIENDFLPEPTWTDHSPGEKIFEYPIGPGNVMVEDVFTDGEYDYTKTITYLGILENYVSPYGTKQNLAVIKQSFSGPLSLVHASYVLYELGIEVGMILKTAQIDVHENDGSFTTFFQEWDFRNIDFGTGIPEITSASNIEVYPNPTSDLLNIRSSGNQHFEIYDSRGRWVDRFYSSSSSPAYDVSHLHQGLYILKSETGNTQRFMVTSIR